MQGEQNILYLRRKISSLSTIKYSMMKKLSFTLLLAALFCLAACGNNQNKKAEAVVTDTEACCDDDTKACCDDNTKACCGDECDGTCDDNCEEGCEHHNNE